MSIYNWENVLSAMNAFKEVNKTVVIGMKKIGCKRGW